LPAALSQAMQARRKARAAAIAVSPLVGGVLHDLQRCEDRVEVVLGLEHLAHAGSTRQALELFDRRDLDVGHGGSWLNAPTLRNVF